MPAACFAVRGRARSPKPAAYTPGVPDARARAAARVRHKRTRRGAHGGVRGSSPQTEASRGAPTRRTHAPRGAGWPPSAPAAPTHLDSASGWPNRREIQHGQWVLLVVQSTNIVVRQVSVSRKHTQGWYSRAQQHHARSGAASIATLPAASVLKKPCSVLKLRRSFDARARAAGGILDATRAKGRSKATRSGRRRDVDGARGHDDGGRRHGNSTVSSAHLQQRRVQHVADVGVTSCVISAEASCGAGGGIKSLRGDPRTAGRAASARRTAGRSGASCSATRATPSRLRQRRRRIKARRERPQGCSPRAAHRRWRPVCAAAAARRVDAQRRTPRCAEARAKRSLRLRPALRRGLPMGFSASGRASRSPPKACAARLGAVRQDSVSLLAGRGFRREGRTHGSARASVSALSGASGAAIGVLQGSAAARASGAGCTARVRANLSSAPRSRQRAARPAASSLPVCASMNGGGGRRRVPGFRPTRRQAPRVALSLLPRERSRAQSVAGGWMLGSMHSA